MSSAVLHKSCFIAVAAVASVGAGPAGAADRADAAGAARTYVVTTVSTGPTGRSVVRETLGLAADGSHYRLMLASNDGAVVWVPVSLTADGAIESGSQDAAITCYNMAMDVVAQDRSAANDPAAVFVEFGNSVVRIPLAVREARTAGTARTIALRGTSTGRFSNGEAAVDAGIDIHATVDENMGILAGATFDERHYLGTPAQVVGRSTCVIQRAERTAITDL